MNNRKATSGRYSSDGFIETKRTTFVGGKTYSENMSTSNKYIVGMIILLILAFVLLYNFVPEFRYVVNLFI
jgi:hypothetical protein